MSTVGRGTEILFDTFGEGAIIRPRIIQAYTVYFQCSIIAFNVVTQV